MTFFSPPPTTAPSAPATPAETKTLEQQFVAAFAKKHGSQAGEQLKMALAQGQKQTFSLASPSGTAPTSGLSWEMFRKPSHKNTAEQRRERRSQAEQSALDEAAQLDLLRRLAQGSPEAQGLLREIYEQLENLRRLSGVRRLDRE